VKPLDRGHWADRYYHAVSPPAEIAKTGATVVNIHHANPQNRYINYPFLSTDQLKPYVRECHKHGLKRRSTTPLRELTNHVVEVWAVRSLGGEVFADGQAAAIPGLHEHFGTGYIPAWHCWFGAVTCARRSSPQASRDGITTTSRGLRGSSVTWRLTASISTMWATIA